MSDDLYTLKIPLNDYELLREKDKRLEKVFKLIENVKIGQGHRADFVFNMDDAQVRILLAEIYKAVKP